MTRRPLVLVVLAVLAVALGAGCVPSEAGPASDRTTIQAPGTGAAPVAAGPVLPRADLTPGRAAPADALNGTREKLCAAGFTTRSVRPSSSTAKKLETDRLAAYGLPTDQAGHDAYELDHLISLTVGGAPFDPANLWPEPWERDDAHPTGPAAPGTGAQSKDRVEAWLHRQVCSGAMTLADAQAGEAANWAHYLAAADTTR